jgi:hypothetical protein
MVMEVDLGLRFELVRSCAEEQGILIVIVDGNFLLAGKRMNEQRGERE